MSFDLGGTIVQPAGGKATTALIAEILGVTLTEARAWMGAGPKLHRLSPADLAAALAAEFGRPDAGPELENTLAEARRVAGDPPLFDDVVPALTELRRRGYLLVALSNVLGSSAPDRDPAYYRHFDAVLPSYDTGVCKPASLAFTQVEDVTGLRPQELVHVGDSLRVDVHGARAAGWHSLHLDRSRSALAHDGFGPSAAPYVTGLPALLELLPAAPVHEFTAGAASCV